MPRPQTGIGGPKISRRVHPLPVGGGSNLGRFAGMTGRSQKTKQPTVGENNGL